MLKRATRGRVTPQQRVAALCAQEQMEAAYCLLMKVTAFGPSCGEDRTSCATRKLENRAARPVTENLAQRAAPREAQEANLLLWFKGTVQPELECQSIVVAFTNPHNPSGVWQRVNPRWPDNSKPCRSEGQRVKLLSQQHGDELYRSRCLQPHQIHNPKTLEHSCGQVNWVNITVYRVSRTMFHTDLLDGVISKGMLL